MASVEQMVMVNQTELAKGIFQMTLQGQLVSQLKAGQFLHLLVPDSSRLLRRPLSIAKINRQRHHVTLIYRVEGQGTKIFSQLKQGASFSVMGPQGNGFDTDFLKKGQKVLLVGGGIGTPPLLALAEDLARKGMEIRTVLGFSNKEAVILVDDFLKFGRVDVSTDDGSYGTKGTVSKIIESFDASWSAVYACGSKGMLTYIDRRFADHPHAYLSTESRMACGMGACYACVVHLKNQDHAASLRVCEDGPVFKTGRIVL